jgi:predicted aminopeptidase
MLAPIGTYFNLVPAFKQLLANLHNNFPAFYKEVKRIGALPKKERDRVLQALMKKS